MPTDNRATAERIAREVYAARNVPPHATEPRSLDVALVLAGMAHRDRTAEREAARKAWDAAAERRYGPGWPIHSSSDKARDAYLAAEFDAGERVTEPKAAPVLTWHDDGFRKQVLADETGRIVGSVDDGNAYLSDRGHIGRYVTPQQARDAVKRLAKQRGAER